MTSSHVRYQVVAGIGCRSGVSIQQVEAAIEAALRRGTGLNLTSIATPAAKSDEPAIVATARALGVPLVPIAPEALEAANPRTLTRSTRSMAAMKVHSVAEASALAAAGAGSRLLGTRTVVGPVTCALAVESFRS